MNKDKMLPPEEPFWCRKPSIEDTKKSFIEYARCCHYYDYCNLDLKPLNLNTFDDSTDFDLGLFKIFVKFFFQK